MAAVLICFVTYNVVLFSIAKFEDHYASFWLSYVFMLIAFILAVVSGVLLRSRDIQPKDWIFGYPILKHCVTYILVELVVSTVFMLLDMSEAFPWGIAFAVQFVIMALFSVLIISCFFTHESIVDVTKKVKDATTFIRLLRVDVEMVAEKATLPEVKQEFLKLAEQVRYSDPMSNACLFELEKQISQQVNQADLFVQSNDMVNALACCRNASLLLAERNKKCKVLK